MKIAPVARLVLIGSACRGAPGPEDWPDSYREIGLAIDAAEVLIRSGVDLIVFDSVAATLPQAEQGKRLHDC